MAHDRGVCALLDTAGPRRTGCAADDRAHLARWLPSRDRDVRWARERAARTASRMVCPATRDVECKSLMLSMTTCRGVPGCQRPIWLQWNDAWRGAKDNEQSLRYLPEHRRPRQREEPGDITARLGHEGRARPARRTAEVRSGPKRD